MAPAVQRMAELTWGAAETAWTVPVNGIFPNNTRPFEVFNSISGLRGA